MAERKRARRRPRGESMGVREWLMALSETVVGEPPLSWDAREFCQRLRAPTYLSSLCLLSQKLKLSLFTLCLQSWVAHSLNFFLVDDKWWSVFKPDWRLWTGQRGGLGTAFMGQLGGKKMGSSSLLHHSLFFLCPRKTFSPGLRP